MKKLMPNGEVATSPAIIKRRVVTLLKQKRWHIATAEANTAGTLASYIADIPGVSDVLEMGFVAYTDRAKIELLDVPEKTLYLYTAVSEQTAAAMVQGAAMRASTEVAISITGYTEPADRIGVSVGTVCFGYYVNGNILTETIKYPKTMERSQIRKESALHALKKIFYIILETT